MVAVEVGARLNPIAHYVYCVEDPRPHEKRDSDLEPSRSRIHRSASLLGREFPRPIVCELGEHPGHQDCMQPGRDVKQQLSYHVLGMRLNRDLFFEPIWVENRRKPESFKSKQRTSCKAAIISSSCAAPSLFSSERSSPDPNIWSVDIQMHPHNKPLEQDPPITHVGST